MTLKPFDPLSQILDGMEDGVYIIREDMSVEYMNHAMVREVAAGKDGRCYERIFGRGDPCPWCRAPEVFAGQEVHWEHHMTGLNRTFGVTEYPIRKEEGSISKVSVYRDVTLRKSRERTLRASQDDYTRLFEHVGVGVYISSKEGKFLNANQALLDMLGYESKDEFLSMDIAEDLYLHAADRRTFQELIERHGRVIDHEVMFKRRDGTPVPVHLTSHVRLDPAGNVLGYEGIIADQSQRKRMEEEIRDAHRFLNMIIHNSPNPIMATNMKGEIILWNSAAEETLGYAPDEVVGKMNIRSVYPDGMARQVMKAMRGPEHGGRGRLRSYPMVYVRRDGNIVEGTLSAAILHDASGKEIASVGIFADLKERLDMERSLRETQEKLLQSEKLAAMGKLTSQIAHELNNPLYGIMNTLELLKTEIAPESRRRRILDMSLSETERLTELLRKMLSFSKPDEEEKQPTSMNTILDEILLLVGKQLQEHSIRVNTSFEEDLPLVSASRNQLRQVFLNMIANARDAMPDGGTLTVRTSSEGSGVHIEIEDTGVGIREENLGRIFDTFFTTKDTVKDVGLGLSLCYGFVKEHGGTIRVKSRHGHGTTFLITLPVGSGSGEPTA